MMATGKLASEVVIKKRLDQVCAPRFWQNIDSFVSIVSDMHLRDLQECVQGFEYAGRSEDGKRWMGMVICKTMATLVECDKGLLWAVPDEWTLEEAATVPVVYGTASTIFINNLLTALLLLITSSIAM